MKTYSCNQCHTLFRDTLELRARKKIHKQGTDGFLTVGCCHNPECPNYGLIQQPLEEMK